MAQAVRALLLFLAASVVYAQFDSHTTNKVITHLFEWKWADVANECENFLADHGYGGVQVSPPNEYAVVFQENGYRPWWERYQPVSYNIISRSGDETDFVDMISRCNAKGVRIYVDVVVNHMTGNDVSPGIGGSTFDYNTETYDGVPYSSLDFNDNNCPSSDGEIDDYGNANQVRNCKLSGLVDLNQGTDYVRGKIEDYLNHLISLGVAGFRMDAAKHMWPGDLTVIFDSLNDLNTTYFASGSKPFIYQEVIDPGNEAVKATDYTGLGYVTEFQYSKYLGQAFQGQNDLQYLNNFGTGWGLIDSGVALVFIDNHDNQRQGDTDILTFRKSRQYKMATAFGLAWPYGFNRVMSSYDWTQNIVNGNDENNWQGPPHDSSYNIITPTFDSDGACDNNWICEHRWRQIYNMVHFHNLVDGTSETDWWDNASNQISFCRGSDGFIAINGDSYDMKQTLQTCLPAGTYCDIISGDLVSGSCTGKTVTVGSDGKGYIEILTTATDGVMALVSDRKQ